LKIDGGEILEQPTKCPGCGKKFDSYDELIDHVVEAHNSTCQVCGAELYSKEELLEHNKEKHGF
jgi:predicted amidophosphoribosyltransferase